MSEQASGTFDIDAWEPLEPADPTEGEAGIELGRVRLRKTFRGGLTGTSTVQMVTAGTAEGPSAYVAIEHVRGAVGERTGEFVLRHSATAADAVAHITVVPGTGTGGFAGMAGTLSIEREGTEHRYSLDFTADGQ